MGWTGWHAIRVQVRWHTRAECAQGGRGMGSVCEAHLHPVALLPGKSAVADESVVKELEPGAQGGSRRAMVPDDCHPSLRQRGHVEHRVKDSSCPRKRLKNGGT